MSPFDGSFSCEPLPDRAGVEGRGPRWLVSVPGRGRPVWEGFETGPVALSGEELEALSRHLLGIGLEEVGPAATRELRPFVSDGTATNQGKAQVNTRTDGIHMSLGDLSESVK